MTIYGDATYGGIGYGGSGAPGPLVRDFVIYIDGVDHTGIYRNTTFRMSADIRSRWTATLQLVDKTNAVIVRVGQTVKIRYDAVDIFGGTINRVSTELLTPTRPLKIISLELVDFTQIADKRLASGVFPSQLAGDIVRSLADKYLAPEGVTRAHVQDGSTIAGGIKFQSVKVSSAFDRIAKLIGYSWRIDSKKQLHFFARSSFTAAYEIVTASRPDARLSIDRTREQYRNVQFIRAGHDVGAARARTFAGDGETSTFHVDAPIAEVPTVEVEIGAGGFNTKTVGIRGIDDDNDAAGFDWFWSKSETGISQNRTDTALAAADSIRVTFQPLFKITQVVVDTAAVADRRTVEGGTGRYEAAANDAEIEDAALAVEFGEAFLRQHARINTIANVTTYTPGLLPGQLQRIEIAAEGIDTQFLITEVELADLGHALKRIELSYRAVDNEADGGWQEFFKRLIDAGRQLSIGGPEIIFDIAQVIDGLIISDDASSTASGDSMEAITADAYSVLQVGATAWVGSREVIDGQVVNFGAEVGTFVNS